MTVVQREKHRRWGVVLAAVAGLAALPGAVGAWPSDTPEIDVGTLRQRIAASAGQPFQGYAESVGALGLPDLPRLGQITSLLSGTTRMRAWYAARDSWRVDVVGTGAERGFYQTPDGQYTWDYGANQLTHIAAADSPLDGAVIVEPGAGPEFTPFRFVPAQAPARLPRAADLTPPDLARRLVAMAAGDRIESLPGARVAGIDAAGLRITSADPHSTVGGIDIWADPDTGLPLRVAASARGAERPVLVTRFLDVDLTTPGAGVLTPPARRPALSFTHTNLAEGYDTLFRQAAPIVLPDRLAGRTRRPPDDSAHPYWRDLVARYGTGLTQLAVLSVSPRTGDGVYDAVARYGRELTPGSAAMISSSLLSVLVLRPPGRTVTSGDAATAEPSLAPGQQVIYLVAGMVDAELLQRVGEELTGGAR